MNLRLVGARQQGLDEATVSQLDRYETSDLPERQKVALRLADAVMTQPAQISAELRDQVHTYFSREEIVELVLDVTKWSTQKIQVSLGTDQPVDPAGLADLDFAEDGRPVLSRRPG